MKKYTTWLSTVVVFQLLTAAIHTIGLFIAPAPHNETEKQLISLMDTYKIDFGAGFHRTTSELSLALSACFSLLCFLSGLLNWHLLRKKTAPAIMKGVMNINLLIFGICFSLMAMFTFLPPIIFTGLITLFLLLSRITLQKLSD